MTRHHDSDPLPTVAEQFARAYLCPDCDAVTELSETEPNLWRLLVLHDDSCPTYRALEQSR